MATNRPQWYIEYYTDSAGNLAGKVVEALSPPNPSGNINSVSPAFSSMSAAQAQLNQNKGILGQPVSANNILSNPAGNVAGLAGETAPTVSGLDAIGNFFNKIGEKSTWIRIGEGVVAIILLDVGLKAFTGHSVIESTGKKVTGGTKEAAKFAIFK